MDLKLITDRTKADVDLVASIAEKIKKGAATEAERQYYLYGETIPLECLDGPLACTDGPLTAGNGVTKGGYNASDLNRVEGAAVELAEKALTLLEDLQAYLTQKGVAPDELFQPFEAGDVQVTLPILPGRNPLPEGYTALEFISAGDDRDCWIDTGFQPNNNTRVLLDCEVEKAASDATYFIGLSQYEANANYQLRIASANQYCTSDFGADRKNFPVLPAGRYLVDKDKNVCAIGGTVVTNAESAFQCASHLLLLASTTTAGIALASPGTVYSCKIYDDNMLIRDLMPCQDPAGGVGLYDLANATFYPNAGTGEFTAGPEVPGTQPHTTWLEGDYPLPELMERYLANVAALRALLPLPADTPTVPPDMDSLTYQEANDIERILLAVDEALEETEAALLTLIDNTAAAFWYSGELYAGEI